jgi:hypothetical protein
VFGKHSATWQLADADRPAAVSIDYPWRVWHDLTVCYRAGGWEILDQQPVPLAREPSASINRIRLRRGDRLGVVYFQLYDLEGKTFVPEPTEGGLFGDWLQRAKRRLAALNHRGEPPRTYYQLQAFAEFYDDGSSARVETQLLSLFEAAKERVVPTIRNPQ